MKIAHWFIPFLLVGLSASCVNAQVQTDKVRIMSYNIQWFSEDANPERISNLNSIFNAVKPNIVAFQEVQSRRAIQQIFPSGTWSLAMKDDPKEDQEVGLAVRTPWRIVKSDMLFSSPAVDFAFPGGRDVLRAEVVNPEGKSLVFYVVHMKSRRGSEKTPRGFSGRNETDQQRELAAGMLAGWLAGFPDENSIVLGDFNDTPDDRSMNILESGNVMAKAGPERAANPLMVNLFEDMYRNDWVSLDLDRKFLGEPITAQVPGAYESNESLRGKAHRFPDDVKVSQTLFDQIVVRPKLAGHLVGKPMIFSGAEALRGSDGRTNRNMETGTTNYVEKGTKASDHLPVYIDLKLP